MIFSFCAGGYVTGLPVGKRKAYKLARPFPDQKNAVEIPSNHFYLVRLTVRDPCSSHFTKHFFRMLITMVYDGHVRSLGILSYSVFVTNSLAGSLELPADMVPVATLDRIGRRWTLFFSMGLSGVVSIATGLTPIDQTLAIAIMALAGRFFITIAMNTGVQYTVELVPTQLRGQGVGVVHITGHCATFFAPFILYLVSID